MLTTMARESGVLVQGPAASNPRLDDTNNAHAGIPVPMEWPGQPFSTRSDGSSGRTPWFFQDRN